ncbi:MAG TPA: hypothetical protein VIL99_04505 [Ignavibacteria bacterium]
MNNQNIPTEKDFNEVIKYLISLNTPDEKRRYLTEVKKKYSEFLEKPGIKLLSTDHVSKIRDYMNRIEKHLKFLEIENLRNNNKKIPGNYIPWIYLEGKPYSLIKELINRNYFYNYNIDDVESISNQHFFWKGCKSNREFTEERIRCNLTNPLLVYLFERLIEYKIIDDTFKKDMYSKLIKRIGDEKGDERKNLGKIAYKSKKRTSKDGKTEDVIPQNSDIIDKVISKVFGKKDIFTELEDSF